MSMIDGLSESLGYISICMWLGAQFPQVVENYKQQSVDGLALPFLANWLFGDITNLIGCILTHQLPFQTYLATYFVFVDFTLLIQYYYYTTWRAPSKPPPGLTRALSHDRSASRYRALSAAAAQVAVTAAQLAAHEADESAGAVDDAALGGALTESFESLESSRLRRKTVAWGDASLAATARRAGSVGPYASHQQQTAAGSVVDVFGTGERRMSLDRGASVDAAGHTHRSSRGGSTKRRSASAVVFLGAWALFGVGTLVRVGRTAHVASDVAGSGRVLGVRIPLAADVRPTTNQASRPSDASQSETTVEGPVEITFVAPPAAAGNTTEGDGPDHKPPSTERIIGRISAWICTTLYLTSRLPQIWKNFVRKSVEGLSIYLFIFAFLGNTFYVSSILTSPSMRLPPPEAFAFLKESLPYLLGSAGTLMFDVTIVLQALVYKGNKPVTGSARHTRGRSGSTRETAEERAGLLEHGAHDD